MKFVFFNEAIMKTLQMGSGHFHPWFCVIQRADEQYRLIKLNMKQIFFVSLKWGVSSPSLEACKQILDNSWTGSGVSGGGQLG